MSRESCLSCFGYSSDKSFFSSLTWVYTWIPHSTVTVFILVRFGLCSSLHKFRERDFLVLKFNAASQLSVDSAVLEALQRDTRPPRFLDYIILR